MIRLFIYFDVILRIEELLRTCLIKPFVVANIPIMLMELFDFIYYENYYIDHGRTNITTRSSPCSVF